MRVPPRFGGLVTAGIQSGYGDPRLGVGARSPGPRHERTGAEGRSILHA